MGMGVPLLGVPGISLDHGNGKGPKGNHGRS